MPAEGSWWRQRRQARAPSRSGQRKAATPKTAKSSGRHLGAQRTDEIAHRRAAFGGVVHEARVERVVAEEGDRQDDHGGGQQETEDFVGLLGREAEADDFGGTGRYGCHEY